MAEQTYEARQGFGRGACENAGDSLLAQALGEDLLWRAVRRRPFGTPRPCLFLDRDGVIIEECQYLCDPAHVRLLPGAARLIKTARSYGYAVVVVTNQAGIGRDLFGWAEFASVETRVADLLSRQDCGIDAAFACPFHREGRPPYDQEHLWRKPHPGMLLEAAALLNLDLSRSLLVGDKASDILAARAADLPRAVHVRTGHGVMEEAASRAAISAKFKVSVEDSAVAVAAHLGHS